MTPAIRALDTHHVAYTIHEYDHDGSMHDFGMEAAEQLGLDPAHVFKTLIVEVDGSPAVVIVPVSGQVALKQVARAARAKRARMCDPAIAERVTGYVRGGISPFGQKQRLATMLDRSAMRHDVIYVSGGRRGLDIAVAPTAIVDLLDASVADIAG